MGEADESPRLSYVAVVGLCLASLWYVGWGAALAFAVAGLKDPQGWNWLPYVVWGIWGLPVAILAVLLGAWSLGNIRGRAGRLTGGRLALTAVILSLLAGPVWYVTPWVVNLWK